MAQAVHISVQLEHMIRAETTLRLEHILCHIEPYIVPVYRLSSIVWVRHGVLRVCSVTKATDSKQRPVLSFVVAQDCWVPLQRYKNKSRSKHHPG
jgi:hypothetical protein